MVIFVFNTIAGKIIWHKGTNNTAPLASIQGDVVYSAIADVKVPNVEELQQRANGVIGTLGGGMAFFYNKEGALTKSAVFQQDHRGPTIYTIAQRLHHIINVFAGKQVDATNLSCTLFHPPETSKMTATMARNVHAEWVAYTRAERRINDLRAQLARFNDADNDFFESIERMSEKSTAPQNTLEFPEIDALTSTEPINDLSLPDFDESPNALDELTFDL